MKTMKLSSLAIPAFVALLLMAQGCQMKMGSYIPNTRFAYPNSNVEPLGNVSGSASRWGFLAAPDVDQGMIDEAMTTALKQKGGDLMVNIKWTSSVFFPILPIYKTTLEVSGIAAKMTVGKQELK